MIAEQFCKADSVLNGNYDYSYFDYAQMKGMINQIPLQQDAAGGHGYVLYAAYKQFGISATLSMRNLPLRRWTIKPKVVSTKCCCLLAFTRLLA